MPFKINAAVAGLGSGLILGALAQQATAQPLVSSFNGSVGAFAGYGREAGGGQTFNNINSPPNDTIPFPADGCLPINNCFIFGSSGGKQLSGLNWGGEGRLSMPLGQSFGLQADGTVGALAGKPSGSVRGHAFTGQPGTGTLGGLVQYSWLDSGSFVRAGVEGQVWLAAISLYASGGYQWADRSNEVSVKSGVFACGEARWYAADNAYLGIGGDWTSSRAAGFVNGEFQFSGDMRPLSIYARGGLGEDGYRSAIAGFRWQFGPGQTLIARHRQDTLLPYAACGEEQFFSRRVTDFGFTIE